jgi:hypothetical protein
MGDMQSAQQAIAYGSIGASSAVGGLVAAGVIGTAAVPFIGPALAVATMVIGALIKNSGCGQTCIQTSQWANQAADALQKNLDAYMATPTPRPASAQALALQNFDNIWGQLVKMCADPQWGDAGKACISDRQQGACKWKNNGVCWNWFTGYRDPIANDSNVAPDHLIPSSVLDAIASGGSSSLLPLALIAGLVILGVSL